MKFCFLLLFFLISCSNPRFEWYEVVSCEDLRQIPLIKPYELFSTNARDSVWGFSFVANGELDECGNNFDAQMTVSAINVKKDIIYGYCDEFSSYFVVIPSRKFEKKFEKKSEWLLYLKENNQGTDTFYRPDMLFKIFNYDSLNFFSRGRYKALPWYNQIKDLIK